MYIARCYFELKRKAEAKKFLSEALIIAPADESEKELLEEAKKMLAKC